MSFKEQVNKDLNVFFNFDEFADEHILNGQKILAILESNENHRRAYDRVIQFNDGIVEHDFTLIYKFKDFPYVLAYRTELNLDGVKCIVINFALDYGVVTLKLQRLLV